MSECPFAMHQMAADTETGPNSESMTIACAICGVGHTFRITWTGHNRARVDTIIFPAEGSHTISREVIRWSIASCEGTVGDMEQDGVIVTRGSTDIQGQPVGL
ncbi:MAG TPA: hypothetical protein VFI12_07085 [Thermomicrobiales bacterium]|jgi:hypothetical protein|nr:hypothetical protein [Thermomicrobiales bacterium]